MKVVTSALAGTIYEWQMMMMMELAAAKYFLIAFVISLKLASIGAAGKQVHAILIKNTVINIALIQRLLLQHGHESNTPPKYYQFDRCPYNM